MFVLLYHSVGRGCCKRFFSIFKGPPPLFTRRRPFGYARQFCVTSTRNRHLGAPNLERHAHEPACARALAFLSTSPRSQSGPKNAHVHAHARPLEPILGPSWAILGPLGANLAPSWAILGLRWPSTAKILIFPREFNDFWAHPDPILGPLGAILGPSWGHLGPSWGQDAPKQQTY